MEQREMILMAGVALALIACLYVYKELQNVKSSAAPAPVVITQGASAEKEVPEKTD